MKTIAEIVLADQKNEYDNYLQDVLSNGCQSGMVSNLIYYADTQKFYEDHKEEINTLLEEFTDSTGLSMSELFGNKFDSEDQLCLETSNQNLLAWFSYEETARKVLEDQGVEY